MARSRLSILYPAYHTVTFDGVPMFRAQAWALLDARRSGVRFSVASADRRQGVAEKYGHQSQFALYQGWLRRLPGYYPANPPGYSSHELRSDGSAVYRVRRGAAIPKFMLGIDANDAGASNSCEHLVRWLNAHGYHAVRPYSAGSEAHHFSFTKSPAYNARRRIAAQNRKARR
jgi:hypothetical protein